MNEFSLVCRLLGSLFYRQPQDPLLVSVFTLLQEGKLQQNWPLEQDELLGRLQSAYEPESMAADYAALFSGTQCSVSPVRSVWTEEAESEVRTFLQQCGMPLGETAADHFGLLLLAASWLEDHAEDDESLAQLRLFDEYLLPWSDRFLGKVEAHASTVFYRTLAQLTREALYSLREELADEQGSEQ